MLIIKMGGHIESCKVKFKLTFQGLVAPEKNTLKKRKYFQ